MALGGRVLVAVSVGSGVTLGSAVGGACVWVVVAVAIASGTVVGLTVAAGIGVEVGRVGVGDGGILVKVADGGTNVGVEDGASSVSVWVAGASGVLTAVLDAGTVVAAAACWVAGCSPVAAPDRDRITANMITNARTPTATMATITSFPTSRCMNYPSGSKTGSSGRAK